MKNGEVTRKSLSKLRRLSLVWRLQAKNYRGFVYHYKFQSGGNLCKSTLIGQYENLIRLDVLFFSLTLTPLNSLVVALARWVLTQMWVIEYLHRMICKCWRLL